MYVSAIGDSPLDLDMFRKAGEAIVVVSDEQTRNKTIKAASMNAIDLVLTLFMQQTGTQPSCS